MSLNMPVIAYKLHVECGNEAITKWM